MAKFTHLHVHSEYSLLDGLVKIDDLIAQTKAFGMESVALTDHGTLYGAVEFFQKAKTAGIKPVIGCEVYVTPNKMSEKNTGDTRFHLTLLVKNETGYANLVQLVTKAHIDGFYYKPRVDKERLAQHAEGLVCLSGCPNAQIPHLVWSNQIENAKNLISEYQSIFGKENFFIELQYHPEVEKNKKVFPKLIELAREMDVPVVATNDVHYIKKDDDSYHDILLAIGTGNKISDANRLTVKGVNLSFRSSEEMTEIFKDFPEALENTQKIAEACSFEFQFGNLQLPHFEIPEGQTAEEYLEKLSLEGLPRIGCQNLDEAPNNIKERFNFELAVIKKTGFASYILIVQDFVSWARKQGIVVGPGRGSAAGSLISYLLGITNVDPIKYDLLFERFLNPDRIAPPDIDLDFADHRRDEVIDYVAQKYGRNHVAQIITFGRMAARAAIRDVGRASGLSYSFCDQIAKMVPFGMNLKEACENSPELKQATDTDPQARSLIDAAMKLEGLARHASTHACGVVITKKPTTSYMPIQWAAQSNARSKGEGQALVTQYEMHAIEDLGLLKMDFLGLRNLTIIEKTLNLVEQNQGQKIDVYEIPLNDAETFRMLQKADTTGIFQLESQGMRRYLKELKPTELEDIVAMVALFRPGPMELIPSYIARKHGREQITYLHPKLEPILKKTYGIAVYQEQLMKIAHDLAGFTLAEADILRKAVGKKIKKLLDEQSEKMIQGMVKNNIPAETAVKIWQFVEPFARYGFNRSHAVAYALIAYQTAYLKTKFPREFMTSLLNAEGFDIERVAFLASEAKHLGIDVLPPDVNESFESFALVNTDPAKKIIRFGFGAVKNLGVNTIAGIISQRETRGRFTSIQNFLERIPSKDLNKKSLESLIKCGALDAFGERKHLFSNIEEMLRFNRDFAKSATSSQVNLFETHMNLAPLKLAASEAATKNERLAWEKELLGLYISEHPLDEYRNLLTQHSLTIQKVSPALVGNMVSIAGIISGIQKIVTKNGKMMLFTKLEDWVNKIEVVVFPTTLEENPSVWQENKIIMVRGKVSDRDGNLKVICDTAQELKLSAKN